jgi:uncharacterized membrane protein
MGPDVGELGETISSALGKVAHEATHVVSQNGRGGDGALSGMRGVAAGAAVAAAAPLAAKGAQRVLKSTVAKRVGASRAASGLKEQATEGAKGAVADVVGRKIDQAGGAPGVVKQAATKMIPGVGGGAEGRGGDGDEGAQGTGKGRRMPVQQAVDVGVPLRTAYDQWTQFEEWPQFMHRVMEATQEDDCTVSFKVKLWAMSKQFKAQIVEQRPDERIQWQAREGVSHSGVVTFHELAPHLTRVQVSLDVEPGSLVEKAARGMRHVKRAVRGDMARYKAFVELQDRETGAWRGTIHEGRVVERSDSGSSGDSGSPRRSQRRGSARPRSQAAARSTSGRSGGRRGRAASGRRRG